MTKVFEALGNMTLTRLLFLLGLFTSPLLSLRIESFTLSDFLFVASFLLTVLQYKGKVSRNNLVQTYIFAIGSLILLVSLFSAILNPDPVGSLLVILRFAFLTIFLPWTLITNFQSSAQSTFPINILQFGILFFSLSVIYGAYKSGQAISSVNRNFGLAEHPTDAGGFLSLGSVLWFCSLIRKITLLKLLGFTLINVGILLTGSISAILSTSIGVMVALLHYSRENLREKSALKIGIISVFAALFLYSRNVFSIKQRIQGATSGRYDTVSSRFQNYSESVSEIFTDLPHLIFGHGLSQSQAIVQSEVAYSYAPHNYILQMLYQGGLFFTILVLTYQLSALRNLTKSDGLVRNQLISVMASQVFFALTSPVMFTRYLWFPFILASLTVRRF
jgi:hypothetical protein